MNHGAAPRIDRYMLAVVLYSTLVSAAIRLIPALLADAPLNDGGLFYSMILDLQDHNFTLPLYASYNAAGIPFAYPPLALYATGLLSTLFHWPALDLVRLLPPLISVLSIPAFYLVAREMLDSRAQVALAVVIFALIPRVSDWLMMGGGITRATGFLFALLAIRQLYIVFSTRSDRPILPASLFAALAVCTHPEAAAEVAITAVIFYLLKDRTLRGLARAAIIGFGVLLLSSPWWATVILRHGVGTLLAPLSAVNQDTLDFAGRLFSLFGFEFTDELFLTLIALLGLLGLAAQLVRKQFFLPLWLIFVFLAEPRGGRIYMMVPHAMLAAIALHSLILPGLRNLKFQASDIQDPGQAARTWIAELLDGNSAKAVLGYVFAYGALSVSMVALVVTQKYTLTHADLDAFQWVQRNTGTGAQFALLTGESGLRDASSEWFPALTGRRSLATIFGNEWVNDGRFGEKKEHYDALQSCADQDVTCLDAWSRETSQAIDYVYVRKFVEDRPVTPPLIRYLSLSDEYEKAYESEGVIIFRRTAVSPYQQ